ncbi:hypothetical protein SLE2022_285540 [Rubroshorea leprosula]
MGHRYSKFLRIQDDPGTLDHQVHTNNYEEGRQIYIPESTPKHESPGRNRQSLRAKVLYKVFHEDFDRLQTSILDPQGTIIQHWSKIFLITCLVSLFVDPLFFYLPVVSSDQVCIQTGMSLKLILTIIRSVADVFYIINIFIRFRTAYVAPPSRVFGRGELVIDSRKIASRYLRRGFCIDFIAALPLPQILIWVLIPNLQRSAINVSTNVLRFVMIFQFLPKLLLVFPLTTQVGKAIGFVIETAWLGAAYNLLLFLLASHVIGACWYILSIEREEACWRNACDNERQTCQYNYFDCKRLADPGRNSWFLSSNITNLCTPTTSSYAFGIYGDAVNNQVVSAHFVNKYFYCFWWGLRNLSTLGQNLSTSIYIGEISFSILIGCVGLVLFASLIGNMQRYLLSTTLRLEEWRIKRTDTEKWMHHRQLPEVLRVSVRKYDQYKWLATRGVDEETLLSTLPLELQRDIKRHLCLDLVRRVPLFEQMDERMLDAICERLRPALCTEGTFLVREGDLVNVVLFIVRGYLNSYATNSGDISRFSNPCLIGPGNFCGEELLTWALETDPSIILPSSTRTIKAIAEVEGFALRAEDLKFVVSQFRKKHSKQLRHNFRFHSHQWRTWAANYIQAAWRRYKKRKESADNAAKAMEKLKASEGEAGSAMLKAIIKASSRFGVNLSFKGEPGGASALQKPAEPDFFLDDNAN